MRVLYYINNVVHIRVFERVAPVTGWGQKIIYPFYLGLRNTLLPKAMCTRHGMFVDLANAFKPDMIMVCTLNEDLIEEYKDRNIKLGYVAHGVVDTVSSCNIAVSKSECLGRFDLVCVGTEDHKQMILDNNSGVRGKIVTDVLPQLDTLHYNVRQYKRRTKPEIVLFLHHIGSVQFEHHNNAMVDSMFMLGRLAAKNNWSVIIKPKKNNVGKYLLRNYRSDYRALLQNKNVTILQPDVSPYKYFGSAHVILTAARSSVQIEACLAQVPLGLIDSDQDNQIPNDIFGTGPFGASIKVGVENEKVFEQDIKKLLEGDIKQQQIDFCDQFGLSFDGKHSERMQQAISKVVDK